LLSLGGVGSDACVRNDVNDNVTPIVVVVCLSLPNVVVTYGFYIVRFETFVADSNKSRLNHFAPLAPTNGYSGNLVPGGA
jgi:hypothetical protein